MTRRELMGQITCDLVFRCTDDNVAALKITHLDLHRRVEVCAIYRKLSVRFDREACNYGGTFSI